MKNPRVLSALLAVSLLASNSTLAFAAVPVVDGKASVPVYLSADASPIDITIGTEAPIVDPDPTDPSDDPFVDFDEDGDKDPGEPKIVDPADDDPFVDLDDDGVKDPDEPAIKPGATTFYSDAVYMYAAADSNTASVSSLMVRNNSVASPIFVSGIKLANATTGNGIEAYTDDFSQKQADSGKFGVAVTEVGSAKLSTAADLQGDGYVKAAGSYDSVAAKGSLKYKMAGKVAVSTKKSDHHKVSDCVVTVSMTNVAS